MLQLTPLQWILAFLAAAAVLLLPGGALLAWLPASSRQEPASSGPGALSVLADGIALSISISTLLALWLSVLGIRLGSAGLVALYAICLALLLAGLARRWTTLRGLFRDRGWLLGWLAAVLLVAGLVAWRFYQARTLALPAWVDSVHHTLIVRMICAYGGIPPDFSPYIPAPFFYHFGFHLITALFSAWSGLPAPQAVLWLGQVLNAGVALSVNRAAASLAADEDRQPRWLNRAYPLLAALLVGFVFQMPAYYLTWGRYTLLAGLLLVGPAVAAALDAWKNPQAKTAWLRLGLLITGLCLTHYFAMLIVAIFLFLLGLVQLALWLARRKGWGFLWRLAVVSVIGLLLVSPWLLRIAQNNHSYTEVNFVDPLDSSESARQSAQNYLRYLSFLIGPRRSHILMGIAGVGLLAALLRPRLRLLAAWGLLMALLALPWGLRVNPFRPDHFAIVLFFPAALLAAWLFARAAAALSALTWRWAGPLVLALVTVFLLAWGIRDTRNILNPVTIITTPADVAALDWVKDNTPPDARFYINSTPWQGQVYRGVDGGYWLEPYAQRASLIPPVFYIYGPADYLRKTNEWAAQAAKIQGCTPEFWRLVDEARLNYVYLRKGQGSLQPSALSGCPRIHQVFQAGDVYLYAITP